MYKEILRTIVGIEVFPVLSLLLFVTVFVVMLVWVMRMDRGRLAHLRAPAARRRRRARVSLAPRRPGRDPAVSQKKDELLNHEDDGIREFDNALPTWWLYGFYFTIVFGIVYVINYHVLSTPLWGRPGMVAEYQAEVDVANRLAASRPKAAGPSATLAALTDPDSLEKGQAIFEGGDNLCHACHRKDLGGLVGPEPDRQPVDSRLHARPTSSRASRPAIPRSGMLPYGSGKTLTDEQVLQVVSYVLSKQGTNPASPRAVDPDREKACS